MKKAKIQNKEVSSTTTDEYSSYSGAPWNRKMKKELATIQKEDRPRPNRISNSGIHFYPTLILGSGGTATVYEGYFRDPQNKAAVKCINAEFVNIFKNEMAIWRQVDDSQNILRYKDYQEWTCQGKRNYYIAMELAQSTLARKIQENTERRLLIKYLQDAVAGLSWIFSKKIIHRDIKPDNILIFPNQRAKLSDFGISKRLTSMTEGTTSTGKATLDWAAPEVLDAIDKDEPFKNKPSQDIFSLGLTIYFTLSGGKHPFGVVGRQHNIRFCPPNLLPDCSQYTENKLIAKMLERDPSKRPAIEEVLKYPLFWDPLRALQFIKAVAAGYEDHASNSQVLSVRTLVDEAFKSIVPDWKEMIPEIQPYIFTHKKEYSGESVFKLVELIRDKHTHYKGLPEPLLVDELFGTNGQFDELKYVAYFLKKFPNLVIFLYEVLKEHDNEYSRPRSLRTEYYADEPAINLQLGNLLTPLSRLNPEKDS